MAKSVFEFNTKTKQNKKNKKKKNRKQLWQSLAQINEKCCVLYSQINNCMNNRTALFK